jgi:hypothetical protein
MVAGEWSYNATERSMQSAKYAQKASSGKSEKAMGCPAGRDHPSYRGLSDRWPFARRLHFPRTPTATTSHQTQSQRSEMANQGEERPPPPTIWKESTAGLCRTCEEFLKSMACRFSPRSQKRGTVGGVTPLGATEAAESVIHKNLRAYAQRLGSGNGRSGRKTLQGAGNLL